MAKRTNTHYAVEPFILVKDGTRWGIAQYAVDTTRQNLMHYQVKHWYDEAHEAQNALQVLKQVFGSK